MTVQPLMEEILVVEDDRGLRELIAEELTEAGYGVHSAASVDEALLVLSAERLDLVVSDLRLPGASGLDLLGTLMERSRAVRPAFILITAFGTVPKALEALKMGADDFLTKPLDLDHLLVRVERILEVQRLRTRVLRWQEVEEHGVFHGIIGRSAPMRRVFYQIGKIAEARGPVVITGESGTGKELVAQAIHHESSRRHQAFVPVNCAGVPEHLLESEFFGHTAGAFTGATQARPGLFKRASGGTIFLDEIGELPLGLQAKLLRTLQEKKVRPVGADTAIDIDARVLTATNRSLEDSVSRGEFREDLFYRLSTFNIAVPPLRERPDDLEPLAAHFLAELQTEDTEPSVEGFDEEVFRQLQAYGFPGNVRELKNIIERAVTFSRGPLITVDDLPDRLVDVSKAPSAEFEQMRAFHRRIFAEGEFIELDELKRRYVRWVLEAVDDNKRQAAKLLGIGRRTLYRYLDE